MTTYRSPEEQGRQAYSDDIDLDENPFPPGTQSHSDWSNAWLGAKEDDPFRPDSGSDQYPLGDSEEFENSMFPDDLPEPEDDGE